jgi:hypothetical protein
VDLSLLSPGQLLASTIQAEAGGTGIATGSTATLGAAGGAIADPRPAQRGISASHFEGRTFLLFPSEPGLVVPTTPALDTSAIR